MNAGARGPRHTSHDAVGMEIRADELADKHLDKLLAYTRDLTQQSLTWSQNFLDVMTLCNGIPDESHGDFLSYHIQNHYLGIFMEKIAGLIPGGNMVLLIIRNEDAGRLHIQIVKKDLALSALKLNESGEGSDFYSGEHPNGFYVDKK